MVRPSQLGRQFESLERQLSDSESQCNYLRQELEQAQSRIQQASMELEDVRVWRRGIFFVADGSSDVNAKSLIKMVSRGSATT
jgi:hypothetical protein